MRQVKKSVTRAKGSVTLVGAGCGPGLLTAAGLRAVRQAEVLVYDDLLDPEILKEAPAGCERIYAGKRSGLHSMPQEEISRLLCDRAEAGKNVVRLKGGDSFVFGRGGEECLRLEERGIPYTLIPGVTSAVVVPERFGIPVTHRGKAPSFTVVTGKSGTGTEENYEALAALKGTLVFLMGIRAVPEIADRLMRAGKAPDTPAAVLTRGFSPEEARIDGTLATIGALSEHAPTPGILVIGETAAFRLTGGLRWSGDFTGGSSQNSSVAGGPRENNPLAGCRVTVTGTRSFAEKTAELLRSLGAETRTELCLRIVPVPDQVPETFDSYDWLVFTSANGVELFFETLKERDADLRSLGHLRFACIGPGTAMSLRKHGFHADLVPEHYTAGALGRALVERVKEEGRSAAGRKAAARLLILRAEEGSKELTAALDQATAREQAAALKQAVALDQAAEAGEVLFYEDRGIYRTEPVKPLNPASSSPASDYLVFGSAGGVWAWLSHREIPEGAVSVCIGPFTEEALRKRFGGKVLTAAASSAEGIAEAICRDWKQKEKGPRERSEQ